MNKITRKQRVIINWIENTVNNYYGQDIIMFKGVTSGQAGKFIRENKEQALGIEEEEDFQAELDNIHFGENGL